MGRWTADSPDIGYNPSKTRKANSTQNANQARAIAASKEKAYQMRRSPISKMAEKLPDATSRTRQTPMQKAYTKVRDKLIGD